MNIVNALLLASALASVATNPALSANGANPIEKNNFFNVNDGVNTVSGYLEGEILGNNDTNLLAEKEWSLRGSINVSTTSKINVQFDAIYENIPFSSESHNASTAIHAYYRDPSSFAVGSYVGLNHNNGGVPTSALGGIEAAFFTDDISILGFGAYRIKESERETAENKLATTGLDVRLYAYDNFRFDLGGTVNWYENHNSYEFVSVLNHRLDDYPLTFSAGYKYETVQSSEKDAVSRSLHTVLAGVKYSFGSSSIKDEERNGSLWRLR